MLSPVGFNSIDGPQLINLSSDSCMSWWIKSFLRTQAVCSWTLFVGIVVEELYLLKCFNFIFNPETTTKKHQEDEQLMDLLHKTEDVDKDWFLPA
jgi:hypothetical protein